ncbi:MAG: hypothetical protein JWM68_837 [Verrucomicrobiales bacterium]|nr:hypothetical protein [Verrucomicrobiales bacterium]
MRTFLHILTKPEDTLANELIAKENALPEVKTEIVDLNAGEPDYKALLEKILAADSVQVW